jgi:probable addiction module antidote protein
MTIFMWVKTMGIVRNIKKHSVPYEIELMQHLQNPENAAAYLEAALDDYQESNDGRVFLLALKDLAKAQGGISALAEKTSLNRQALYHTLSSIGNPRLGTMNAIIHALGFRLTVVRAPKS